MSYEPKKDDTKELYIKIWIHYAVGHFNQEQLAKTFECSHDTISNAIKWGAINRLKFDGYVLSEAAQEALEGRLRELRNDLVRIKESKTVNWNAVIGTNRLINEVEQVLWRFQSILQDGKSPDSFNLDKIFVEKHGYEALEESKKSERKTFEIRDVVDSWTDEQKKLFVIMMDGMDSYKDVQVEKNSETIVIKIPVKKDPVAENA